MIFKSDMLSLYAITGGGDESRLYDMAQAALSGGVTMLQLREKNISESELMRRAIRLKELCHRYGVPLIINDNAAVAIECGADGVHVGAEDMPVAQIRKAAGDGFIIGATAKTPEQARAAQDDGADYIGVGAVFPSPTKENALRITADRLKEISGCVKIPSVAIGGICLDNINELRGCGITGVAVVSAIFGADDIKSAAKAMKEAAAEVIKAQ